MDPSLRQTVIGVTSLTVVMLVALDQGFNSELTIAYFIAVIAIVAPETLDRLPFN